MIELWLLLVWPTTAVLCMSIQYLVLLIGVRVFLYAYVRIDSEQRDKRSRKVTAEPSKWNVWAFVSYYVKTQLVVQSVNGTWYAIQPVQPKINTIAVVSNVRARPWDFAHVLYMPLPNSTSRGGFSPPENYGVFFGMFGFFKRCHIWKTKFVEGSAGA